MTRLLTGSGTILFYRLFMNYKPKTINLIVLEVGQSHGYMVLRGNTVIYAFLRKLNGQLVIGNLR